MLYGSSVLGNPTRGECLMWSKEPGPTPVIRNFPLKLEASSRNRPGCLAVFLEGASETAGANSGEFGRIWRVHPCFFFLALHEGEVSDCIRYSDGESPHTFSLGSDVTQCIEACLRHRRESDCATRLIGKSPMARGATSVTAREAHRADLSLNT
jgi:hypothetical protein